METKQIIKQQNKQKQENQEKPQKLPKKRKLSNNSINSPLSLNFMFLMCFFVCFGNNCFLFKTADAMPLLHLIRMYSSNNNQNVNPNGLLFTNNYFYHPNQIRQNNQRLNYLGNTLLRMKSNDLKFDGMKKRNNNNNIFNNQALEDDNDAIVAGLLRQERNEMNAGAPKMYAQNIGELGSTMFRFG
ncbi:hypothetical protein ACQ4LE_009713 [Meloidogyne hapla]|uniref:Uncharacterized protein n=1 Tax=Meloidogyne hapla TaxID=6305 RepID=A0A1I8BH50_MELHA